MMEMLRNVVVQEECLGAANGNGERQRRRGEVRRTSLRNELREFARDRHGAKSTARRWFEIRRGTRLGSRDVALRAA